MCVYRDACTSSVSLFDPASTAHRPDGEIKIRHAASYPRILVPSNPCHCRCPRRRRCFEAERDALWARSIKRSSFIGAGVLEKAQPEFSLKSRSARAVRSEPSPTAQAQAAAITIMIRCKTSSLLRPPPHDSVLDHSSNLQQPQVLHASIIYTLPLEPSQATSLEFCSSCYS